MYLAVPLAGQLRQCATKSVTKNQPILQLNKPALCCYGGLPNESSIRYTSLALKQPRDWFSKIDEAPICPTFTEYPE